MKLRKAAAALVALIIVAIGLSVATSGALSGLTSSQTVPSSGTLTQVETSVNVGVFADTTCTTNASFVDWGAITPGGNASQTVWVKNLGNTPTIVTMSTNGWTPTNAYPSISLSWNREGRTLQPGEVLQATLTLTVSANVDPTITSFSFNIKITGTG